jgi:hypothetical protein
MGADHRTPAVVMPSYRSVHCCAGRSCHKHILVATVFVSSSQDAQCFRPDRTLRATCVQKTTCSDLSQIKYVRWSLALQGRWGVYWLRAVSLNQGGRAVETGMGNALVIK